MGYLQMAKEVEVSCTNASTLIPVDINCKENTISVSQKNPYDKLARSLGLVIGLTGECYFTTIHRSPSKKTTMIFVEKIDDKWEARRETFIKGRRLAVGIRKIINNADFKVVMKQVQNYLRSIKVIN